MHILKAKVVELSTTTTKFVEQTKSLVISHHCSALPITFHHQSIFTQIDQSSHTAYIAKMTRTIHISLPLQKAKILLIVIIINAQDNLILSRTYELIIDHTE